MTMVRRMLSGDETAFDEFANVYLPRLHRFAMNRLDQDRELAREMVQATVVKAIARLETFRGDAALMTWLCACCRTEIAMHFRREGRGGGPDLELDESCGPLASQWGGEPLGAPERELLRSEDSRRVHEALDRLPAHYGRALEWKYLDELPVREIAARLKVGPKAAESLLTRARNAFRETYARLGTEPAG
jgi:RNA polymerase sigma-70 factor (ECF subfamily)